MKQGRLGVSWYGVVWHHVGTKHARTRGYGPLMVHQLAPHKPLEES